MESAVLPILLFIGCAALLSVGMLAASRVLGPSRSGAVKEMPYESGMDPVHDTRRRFDVRFHMVAIAFLIFDVELLFLYPWAVASKNAQGVEAAYRNNAVQMTNDLALTETERVQIIESAVFDGRTLVFVEVMLFILLLTAGFAYAWRKGVFRWR